MTAASQTVALVGRPNVGKSRLFNRLSGRRLSIVHDMPGVTRDVLTAESPDGYELLDTGGIGMEAGASGKALAQAAEEQVAFAMEAASLILFVVDARAGITALDEAVTGQLRRSGKNVLVVANKVDSEESGDAALVFSRFGLGDPIPVSAEHGYGVEELRETILRALGLPDEETEGAGEPPTERIRISLVGRPNVGKSSLANALVDSNRLIVSEVPGTTRDAVELDLDYKHPDGAVLPFRLIDTAGLRSRRKVGSPVEYFSGVRTRHAIENSDVVFLILDAIDGVTRQDQALAGEILESGKGLAVVVNKWDLVKEQWRENPPAEYESLGRFLEAYEKALRKELFFLSDPPVLFVSATTGLKVDGLFETALSVDAALNLSLPTGRLNRLLRERIEARPPKPGSTKRFKLFYAVQVGAHPLRIRLYCNRNETLDASYRRYLERAVVDEFKLRGCPVVFESVGKEARYSGGLDEGEPDPPASGSGKSGAKPAGSGGPKKKGAARKREGAAKTGRGAHPPPKGKKKKR